MASKKPNPADGAVSLKVLSERKDVEAVTKSTPTFMIDPRSIEVEEGFNGRPIEQEHVGVMTAALDGGATFPPLLVRVDNGRVILVDGHHRHQMYLSRPDFLRVQCIEFKGDEAGRVAMMIGSAQGKPLTPLQLGVAYSRLETLGWCYAEIAGRGGKSVQHVKDMIELTHAGAEVTAMVESGEVAAAVALKVTQQAAKGGDSAAKVLADGLAVAQAAGKKKLTPKFLASLGAKAVEEGKSRATATREHLTSMLESPSIDKNARVAVQAVLDTLAGKTAKVVASPSAKAAGGNFWLQGIAESGSRPELRAGAKWLLRVLNNDTVARPFSVMPLDEAIQMEMDSDGAVMAETLCPEAADQIIYLRSAGVK